MSAEPFRFLHAADFHLEQPVCGLIDIPNHLRDLLIDAPYLAAQRVFETAIVEEVDFVVLSGDLLECDVAGPRGMVFLQEQFQRLAQRDIDVYWCGGQIDPPQAWPVEIELPSNVRTFRQGRAEELTHYRGDLPLATIIGKSRQNRQRLRPGDFRLDADGQFTIAAAHGTSDAEVLAKQKFSYWALGGLHEPTIVAHAPHAIRYPGTPQGRTRGETGAHGATLVDVDERGKTQIRFVAADVVRWHDEHLSLGEGATQDALWSGASEAVGRLICEAAERSLLVNWIVEPRGTLAPCLRRGGVADETLAWLRSQFGHEHPVLWSASFELRPLANVPSGWTEEDTILGEFMRGVRSYQNAPDETIDLDAYLSPQHVAGTLAEAVALGDPDVRLGVLREAAALAADLLQGEESAPLASTAGASGKERIST